MGGWMGVEKLAAGPSTSLRDHKSATPSVAEVQSAPRLRSGTSGGVEKGVRVVNSLEGCRTLGGWTGGREN